MTQVDPPYIPPLPLSYQGTTQVDRDAEHLKILSICWYVASGLGALFGLFPIVYIVLGIVMLASPRSMGPGTPPPPFVGWFMIIFGSAFILIVWTGAILGFITAASLRKRRRKVVCYVAAGVACLQIPLGTVLGIFTFLVLSRPTVQASFD